jgi:non-specific serine/threonine protein kinase
MTAANLSAAASGTFPIQLTSFVGRKREVSELADLLVGARLLTLTGPGGSGKTRLAIELTTNSADKFPDGAWLVELAAISEPALVPSALARGVGIDLGSGKPALEALLDHLAKRRALILVDNCEHLVNAVVQAIDPLLRRCPALTVLATSREVLRVPGETAWLVPSLELPVPGPSPPLEELRHYDAVRLFEERARLARSSFSITVENAATVTAICRRLDGMPLAIELAASRVGVMPVAEIEARLDDRFRLLVGSDRGPVARHTTLRAAMDWSHDLMTDDERRLLRRLAVFSGGFTLGAAEAVCGGEGLAANEVLAVLSRLVEKSMVSIKDDRYDLLQTVREYAAEQLQASSELETFSGRHREHFLSLTQRRYENSHLRNTALNAELDNLREALDASLPDHVESGLRMACGLREVWSERGHVEEARHWLGRLMPRHTKPDPLRAEVLLMACWFAALHGDVAVARSTVVEALAIARNLDDRGLLAKALYRAATVALYLDEDYATASQLLEEGLPIARALGDSYRNASIVNGLGLVAFNTGQLDAARSLFEESREIARAGGHEGAAGIAIANLALTALEHGDIQSAADWAREATLITSRLGNLRELAGALSNVAGVAASTARPRQALELAGAISALRAQSGILPLVLEQRASDGWLEPARAALGPEQANAAWERGRSMALGNAVELALAISDYRSTKDSRPPGPLTSREVQVAALVAEGFGNREIATRLFISVRTAEYHVEQIRNKLGFHSRSQIAAWITARMATPRPPAETDRKNR